MNPFPSHPLTGRNTPRCLRGGVFRFRLPNRRNPLRGAGFSGSAPHRLNLGRNYLVPVVPVPLFRNASNGKRRSKSSKSPPSIFARFAIAENRKSKLARIPAC